MFNSAFHLSVRSVSLLIYLSLFGGGGHRTALRLMAEGQTKVLKFIKTFPNQKSDFPQLDFHQKFKSAFEEFISCKSWLLFFFWGGAPKPRI